MGEEGAASSIRCISFNQDAGCFVVGFRSGFRIYNVDPFQEMFHRTFTDGGGIAVIEMLFRSNILGLVTRGTDAKKKTQLLIWDDHQNMGQGEISQKSEILSVRLSRILICVVLEKMVFLYGFRNYAPVMTIDTAENKLGLCAMAPTQSRQVFAFPGAVIGQLRVLMSDPVASPRELDSKSMASVFIQAHSSPLQAIALNLEGTLVATASVKGTIIRVFNTDTGQLLHELRRGTDMAVIYSIAFDPSSSFLASSSDRGTVHIFSLAESKTDEGSGGAQRIPKEMEKALNSSVGSITMAATSGLSSLMTGVKDMLPKYLTAERSYAQFRLPDCKCRNLVAFCGDNAVAVITVDGRYFRATFSKGGDCKDIVTKRFGDTVN